MKCRLIAAMVLVWGLGLASHALAQSTIPATVRSASIITENDRTTIANFLKDKLTALSGDDALAQAAARDALVEAATGNTSPTYLNEYAQKLNDAVLPALDNASMRVRLNAAIVVARVAEKANNIRLKPAAMKLLGDKSDAVLYWGVKASRMLVPVQLRIQVTANDPLIAAIVPAVRDRLKGPITLEAYDALRLDLNNLNTRKTVTPQMIKVVTPEIQKILAAREALYAAGAPDNPQIDTVATNFLVDSLVFGPQTMEEREVSVQLIVDLLSRAACRTQSFEQDLIHRTELVQTLKLVGSAIQVVSSEAGKEAISTAAQAVAKMDSNSSPANIIKVVDDLIAAIVANYKDVKTPDPAFVKLG